MSWTAQPIFFVDFEGSRASGILEYGVVEVLGGRIAGARTRLCRATGRVRAEDVAVHGLEAAALAGHAPFAEEWGKSVWPYPRRSPDFARPGEGAMEWGPWVDSARLYAQFYPQLESGRLESLVAACGLQAELDALVAAHCPPDRRRYHAALYDALAGALLLAALAREPRLAGLTVRQLLALSTLDGDKRDALQQQNLF
ncbi:MAG: 3'-5' exonuclease [Opitutales bacterium]|nr:3'-5' exonuclease [Opitutales bacterium]